MTAESASSTEHHLLPTRAEKRLVRVVKSLEGITNPANPIKLVGAANAMSPQTGFNCSGFTRYALDFVYNLPEALYTDKKGEEGKIRRPRYIRELLAHPFIPVPWEERRPGLMIFFKEDTSDDQSTAQHCGILVNTENDFGKFIHSPGIIAGMQVTSALVKGEVMSFSGFSLSNPLGHLSLRAVPEEFARI